MKCPDDKAIAYTAVVVVCAIAVSLVGVAVTGVIAGAGMLGAGAIGGAVAGGGSRPSEDVQFDRNSALGKLQEMGQKLEESSRKMEAAEKSGDQSAQVSAALEGLGTLLGGGKRVDPIGVEQLTPLVPETFAGLPKRSSSAEKSGIVGLMVSKAEATYSDGSRSVTLDLSDTGGVSGLVGLAGWIGMEGEREDDNGTERTRRIDGRIVHERTSKRGGSNEYGIVVGDRFIVKATGSGVDLNSLKAGVAALDLAKLEAMKAAGGQK
jgi:hypothetical protein